MALAVPDGAPEVLVVTEVLPVAVPLTRTLPEPEINVVAADEDVVIDSVPVIKVDEDVKSDAALIKVLDIVGDVADDSGIDELGRNVEAGLVPVLVEVEAVVVAEVVSVVEVAKVIWLEEVTVAVEISDDKVEVLVDCVSETVVLVLVVVIVVPTVVESGRIGTLVVEIVLELLEDAVVPNDEQ